LYAPFFTSVRFSSVGFPQESTQSKGMDTKKIVNCCISRCTPLEPALVRLGLFPKASPNLRMDGGAKSSHQPPFLRPKGALLCWPIRRHMRSSRRRQERDNSRRDRRTYCCDLLMSRPAAPSSQGLTRGSGPPP